MFDWTAGGSPDRPFRILQVCALACARPRRGTLAGVASPLLPGATIGILGSGQLGRMLGLACRRMGYRLHVFSPERDSPAGQVADREVAAPYGDLDAVRAFAQAVDVVTFEFENVPAATAAAAAEHAPVHPDGRVLHIAQNRLREKTALAEHGFPVTPVRAVASAAEVRVAAEEIGVPAILKSAGFGYDGKGQAAVDDAEQAEGAWTVVTGYAGSGAGFGETGSEPAAVLERRVEFALELSVVAARSASGGRTVTYPPCENRHEGGILDLSSCPAEVPPEIGEQARALACDLMEALDVVGVLCVELFLTTDGELLVNEIAPRPHNSGHLTIEAAATSQFEQQLRAVCGLPLGATGLHGSAAMANLLGDLWSAGPPRWERAAAIEGVCLHLYGKAEARPSRKMGHLTALADTPRQARSLVSAARDLLRPSQ